MPPETADWRAPRLRGGGELLAGVAVGDTLGFEYQTAIHVGIQLWHRLGLYWHVSWGSAFANVFADRTSPSQDTRHYHWMFSNHAIFDVRLVPWLQLGAGPGASLFSNKMPLLSRLIPSLDEGAEGSTVATFSAWVFSLAGRVNFLIQRRQLRVRSGVFISVMPIYTAKKMSFLLGVGYQGE